MKKLLALLLAIVMVLSMVACSDSKKGSDTEEEEDEGYSSAEKVAKAYLKAYAALDAEEVLDTMPKFMWDYYAEDYGLDVDDYTKKELVKALEEDVDEEETREIVIKSAEKSEDYDEDDIDEVMETIANAYELSEKDLDSIKKVEIIALDVEYEEDGETEERTFEVLCVKIDGSWYAITQK